MSAPPPLFPDAAADRALKEALDRPVKIDKPACLRAMNEAGEGDWMLPWVKTAFGPGRLSADEFLYYRLSRNDLSEADRARYVGKRVQNVMHNRCNDVRWFACVHDKALFQTILHAHDLSRPELRAAFARGSDAAWRLLRTDEELAAYLRSSDTYPVFAKPIEGMYSIGAMLLERLDGDEVVTGQGRRVPIERLVAYMRAIDRRGYLFQTPLLPHPALVAALGAALPAARIMVLLDGEGHPHVHRATLKLPLGDNEADNFWRSGNMVAPVDVDAGTLGLAVVGVAHESRRLSEHPESGAALSAVTLPDWAQAKELVVRAAAHFPGIRTQGWDVCFSDRGPVLLELNFGGDLNLHQLAHDEGVLDEVFCEHLRRNAYKGRLPA